MQKLFSCLLYIFTHCFNPEIIYIYIFLRPAKFEGVLIGLSFTPFKNVIVCLVLMCIFKLQNVIV